MQCSDTPSKETRTKERINETKEIIVESNSRRPRTLGQSRPHFVVVWLCASRPSDGRVGKVHVRRHRAGVCSSAGFGIGEVVRRARGRNARMRRRRPAQAGHVRATADTVGAVVIVGRRLQGLRRAVARGV